MFIDHQISLTLIPGAREENIPSVTEKSDLYHTTTRLLHSVRCFFSRFFLVCDALFSGPISWRRQTKGRRPKWSWVARPGEQEGGAGEARACYRPRPHKALTGCHCTRYKLARIALASPCAWSGWCWTASVLHRVNHAWHVRT